MSDPIAHADLMEAQVALCGVMDLLSEGGFVDRGGLEAILRLIEERLERAAQGLHPCPQ